MIVVFYDVFEKLCRSKGISAARFSQDTGVGQSNISMWKSKGATPRGDTLQKVADYFGVSADYLLTGEQKNAPAQGGGTEIGFDDFTYAMHNEGKRLTKKQKDALLQMARALAEDVKREEEG